MNAEKMPTELIHMIQESDELVERIRTLKSKPRLTLSDLRELVNIKVELRRVCPADRYGWLDGRPVIDILKTLNTLEKEL